MRMTRRWHTNVDGPLPRGQINSLAAHGARLGLLILAIILGTVVSASTAGASIFKLNLPEEVEDSWSDISASISSVTYDGSNFSLKGRASQFDVGYGDSADYPVLGGVFIASVKISGMSISSVGAVVDPGELQIDLLMKSGVNPYSTGKLLYGSVTDVLFNAAGELHMLFTVTEGSAIAAFGGVNAVGGLKLKMHGGTGAAADDFSDPFSTGAGTGSTLDTLGVVPEPATYLVWGGLIAATLASNVRMRRLFRTDAQ